MNKNCGKNQWIALIFILFISMIFRIISAIYLGDQVIDLPGTYDQISYHYLALRVLGGYGFTFAQQWWPLTAAGAPTAHWSFLYTLYLTAVYALFGLHPLVARLIQAILVAVLQPILIYLIGRRVFGELVGFVSAALMAVYAYFIYYAATLMTEPFYITAILASLYLAMVMTDRITTGKDAASTLSLLGIGLGLTLGAAVLLRQLFLLSIPFLFSWVLWVSRKHTVTKAIRSLFLSVVVILIMILPFTIYNYTRFGRFVLLNTNAGYAFFWGNNPIYGTHFVPILTPEMGSYQSLIPENLRHLNEAALDQALLKQGLKFVVDDPVRYIKLSISRIPVYFMFWPSSESGTISNIARVASFGILWPFMTYGLLLALFSKKFDFRPSSPIFLLLLFAIIYSAIHLLSWALIRYRLPVDAVMLVFAGLAFVDIYQHVNEWFNLPRTQLRITKLTGSKPRT